MASTQGLLLVLPNLLLPPAGSFAFHPRPAAQVASGARRIQRPLPFAARDLPSQPNCCRLPTTFLSVSDGNDDEIPSDDTAGDEEGVSLASDFFKALQDRNIQLEADDMLDDDDDEDDDADTTGDDDDDDDEEEINFPAGAINAMTGFDAGPGAEDMAGTDGNVTLTNKKIYDELNERVLESAGGFVELVGGASEDDEDEGDEASKPKVYKPPTKVPDPELTAGEVVTTVLEALLHNDVPTKDAGVKVLFGYSSPGSAVMSSVRDEGMTPEEYSEFLAETEYAVLFQNSGVTIDKGDYSFDRKKSFYTARLRVGDGPLDFVSVNFILSSQGNQEDDCWLIDSMLIRPEKMRRGRRR